MTSSDGELRRFQSLEQQIISLGRQIGAIDSCDSSFDSLPTTKSSVNIRRAREIVQSLREELRFIEAQVTALCERNRELENQIGILFAELRVRSHAGSNGADQS